MNRKIVLLIALMVIGVGFLSGCNESTDSSNEVLDSDNDGIGDNSDVFPNNPTEQYDSDGDGVGDNADALPYDSTQWADRDHDGYGDNANGNNPDAFPDDSTEWRDSDNDGVGDNKDIYDSGDGAIKVKIDEFHCDEQPFDDLISSTPDPYFIIEIYAWDSSMEEWELAKKQTSSVFTDQINIYNVPSVIADIDEDIFSVYVNIDVWDSDIDDDDVIDMDDTIEYFNPRTQSTKSYSYDGRQDLKDELDGWIEYTVSVVGQ